MFYLKYRNQLSASCTVTFTTSKMVEDDHKKYSEKFSKIGSYVNNLLHQYLWIGCLELQIWRKIKTHILAGYVRYTQFDLHLFLSAITTIRSYKSRDLFRPIAAVAVGKHKGFVEQFVRSFVLSAGRESLAVYIIDRAGLEKLPCLLQVFTPLGICEAPLNPSIP